MIVGFTGTRTGMSPTQLQHVEQLLIELEAKELHHGDCIGADCECHAIALRLGILVVLHPPNIDVARAFCDGWVCTLPPLSYLERNRAIVDACEEVIAAPRTHTMEQRSGTWSTVRYARSQGKRVYVMRP